MTIRPISLSRILARLKQQTDEIQREMDTGERDIPTLKQWLDENAPIQEKKQGGKKAARCSEYQIVK